MNHSFFRIAFISEAQTIPSFCDGKKEVSFLLGLLPE
jgi:hypothetical protein